MRVEGTERDGRREVPYHGGEIRAVETSTCGRSTSFAVAGDHVAANRLESSMWSGLGSTRQRQGTEKRQLRRWAAPVTARGAWRGGRECLAPGRVAVSRAGPEGRAGRERRAGGSRERWPDDKELRSREMEKIVCFLPSVPDSDRVSSLGSRGLWEQIEFSTMIEALIRYRLERGFAPYPSNYRMKVGIGGRLELL